MSEIWAEEDELLVRAECVRQRNEVAIILGIISPYLFLYFSPALSIKSQKGLSLCSKILHGL